MNVQFEKLKLKCKKGEYEITFSPQISVFHGQISAGKSTIVRLIDYCLGGSLERTPAVNQELIAVDLYVNFGLTRVVFSREIEELNRVQVTWTESKDDIRNLSAPIQSSRRGDPIYDEDVYTISDLILYFLNIPRIKVHISKRVYDPRLAALSFRDIMWYCYLRQDYLDSSFFRLERPPHMIKSRYVFTYILGIYSEKLNELEQEFSIIGKENGLNWYWRIGERILYFYNAK